MIDIATLDWSGTDVFSKTTATFIIYFYLLFINIVFLMKIYNNRIIDSAMYVCSIYISPCPANIFCTENFICLLRLLYIFRCTPD